MTDQNKPFGKLYRQMYNSSVAENWEALVTFQQLIILADWDGIVDMTPSAIARVTNIPREIIENGIKVLEADDPESRSPMANGRRITRLDEHRDWGWQIVNLGAYLLNATDRRAYMRDYMRERRAAEKVQPAKKKTKKKAASKKPDPVQKSGGNTQKSPKVFKFDRPCLIPADFCITERVRNWCEKNKHHPRPEDHFEKFVSHFQAKGTRWKDWDQTLINWIRNTLPGGEFHREGPAPTHRPASHKPFTKENVDDKDALLSQRNYLQDRIDVLPDGEEKEQFRRQLAEVNTKLRKLTTKENT